MVDPLSQAWTLTASSLFYNFYMSIKIGKLIKYNMALGVGKLQVMKHLQKKKDDTREVDKDLYYAAANGRAEQVKTLIDEQGANPNSTVWLAFIFFNQIYILLYVISFLKCIITMH